MSTKTKGGYPSRRLKKPSRRLLLTHEGKRAVAKLLLTGLRPKQVAARSSLSEASVYVIQREYIVVTKTERYPDPPPTEAQEELLPWGYLGTSSKK